MHEIARHDFSRLDPMDKAIGALFPSGPGHEGTKSSENISGPYTKKERGTYDHD